MVWTRQPFNIATLPREGNQGLWLLEGRERPRSREGIGVPVGDLPPVLFPPVDGRHAEGERRQVVGVADPRPGPLDLDDVSQVPRCELGHAIEADRLAVPELGRDTVQRLGDLVPSAHRGLTKLARVTSSRRENIRFFGSGSPRMSASVARWSCSTACVKSGASIGSSFPVKARCLHRVMTARADSVDVEGGGL